MARRRGFFAEMQHQAKLAERRQNAKQRERAQAEKRAEAAQRAAERARLAAERASEQDRKRLDREAAQAHVEARIAEAEDATAELHAKFEELDGILTATLDIDDFVDLEALRITAEHPPFPAEHLRRPIPVPAPIPDPPLPVKHDPKPVRALFGRKQKEQQAIVDAEQQYAADYWTWKTASDELPHRRARQAQGHALAEQERERKLAEAEAQYAEETAARDRDVAEQNEELDQLISGLAYGTVEAVQEYVAIVLANSIYPEWLEVSSEAEFDPSQAELSMRVLVPGPELIPAINHFKYTKSTDEISPVAATQKETKERYASLINNVALRSLHEVFEADRRGIIQSISLELGTETISPATGLPTYVPFIAVAARREEFDKFDLSSVVPAATLEHLGATVSKSPYTLVPISSAGIRRAR
ncbi:hypothetical protein [Microbacterium sp. GXF6406]